MFLKLALVWLRELHKLVMVAMCSSEVPIWVNVENDLTPKSCEVDFLGPGWTSTLSWLLGLWVRTVLLVKTNILCNWCYSTKTVCIDQLYDSTSCFIFLIPVHYFPYTFHSKFHSTFLLSQPPHTPSMYSTHSLHTFTHSAYLSPPHSHSMDMCI